MRQESNPPLLSRGERQRVARVAVQLLAAASVVAWTTAAAQAPATHAPKSDLEKRRNDFYEARARWVSDRDWPAVRQELDDYWELKSSDFIVGPTPISPLMEKDGAQYIGFFRMVVDDIVDDPREDLSRRNASTTLIGPAVEVLSKWGDKSDCSRLRQFYRLPTTLRTIQLQAIRASVRFAQASDPGLELGEALQLLGGQSLEALKLLDDILAGEYVSALPYIDRALARGVWKDFAAKYTRTALLLRNPQTCLRDTGSTRREGWGNCLYDCAGYASGLSFIVIAAGKDQRPNCNASEPRELVVRKESDGSKAERARTFALSPR